MTLVTITEHLRERVILWARAQVGKAYEYGGAGPAAYDCSGLTMQAWAQVGVVLPHSSNAQTNCCQKNPYVTIVGYTPANKAKLQFGDLVFYYPDISHVALWSGGPAGQVVQATNQELGVQSIGIEQYAVPVSLGFMGHQ